MGACSVHGVGNEAAHRTPFINGGQRDAKLDTDASTVRFMAQGEESPNGHCCPGQHLNVARRAAGEGTREYEDASGINGDATRIDVAEPLPNPLEVRTVIGSRPAASSAGDRRAAIRVSSLCRYCWTDIPAASAYSRRQRVGVPTSRVRGSALSVEVSSLVRDTAVMVRVLLIGPTSKSWSAVAEEVDADLARLARPNVELSYRCTGAGPLAIHTDEDAITAAPHVVRAVVDAAADGFDAVIVDCTADPGVVEARQAVTIPIVGAGEALRAAIDSAPTPVRLLTGDELRTLELDALLEQAAGAATVALGGTGYSHLVGALVNADPVRVVLDPLDQALKICLAQLS